MPHVDQDARDRLDEDEFPLNAGELNYLFTKLIIGYIASKGESYQTYNDIMGALEGAKIELYRLKIAPYEDKKIEKNGNVY